MRLRSDFTVIHVLAVHLLMLWIIVVSVRIRQGERVCLVHHLRIVVHIDSSYLIIAFSRSILAHLVAKTLTGS